MKKRIESRRAQKVTMFICFAFAVLDMVFLKDVIHQMNPAISGSLAGAIAFAIALLADYMALDWGKRQGRRESSGSALFMWIFLGLVYLFLRCTSIYYNVIEPQDFSFNAIAYQIFAICLLTASYVTTGLVLRQQAAKYWDLDITNYLDSKAEFDQENKKNAQNETALEKMIETLEGYSENYESLNKQYEKIKDGIRKEEKSVMAQITSRVIKEHPNISPVKAEQVMEEVLRERDLENEKSHQH